MPEPEAAAEIIPMIVAAAPEPLVATEGLLLPEAAPIIPSRVAAAPEPPVATEGLALVAEPDASPILPRRVAGRVAAAPELAVESVSS